MNKIGVLFERSSFFIRVTIVTFSLFIGAFFVAPLSAEDFFREEVTANGTVLIFGGKILNKMGNPIPNISVEIWQTDENGIYHHSGDFRSYQRDRGFQFFGTSISDSQGNYQFRTIIPGKYEPRPRHIHIKIYHSGELLLITQIYFSLDGETTGVGGSAKNLYMDLESDTSSILRGTFDFVVDTGVSGHLILTGSQGEGPYYPLDDVSLFDNDLASVLTE